jgi:predicted anti-sigma-YlaC factor YlaD
MSCKQTTEDATNYLEGPNTFGRRIAHYFHLLMCYRCRRFYRQIQLVIRLSPTILPTQAPSDAEVEALLARLKADN